MTARHFSAAALAALLMATGAEAVQGEECPPAAFDERAVAEIVTGASVRFDDRSELKLMGLLPPSARDVSAPADTWPLEAEARARLQTLLQERRVAIARGGSFLDRYGRLVAHAFADGRDGNRAWLQSALIDEGLARVAPLAGETACMTALLAREAVARAKRAGLWANPAYAVRAARETRALIGLAGSFQIVEGWVSDIGSSRNTAFLNFGDNWKWDFTAAVDLRSSSDRDSAFAKLKMLKGRLVRVRGFIEKRNGPFISLVSADAIEELPEGSAGGR